MKIIIPGGDSQYNYNGKDKSISPTGKEKCIPQACFCETGELLKNGGFETPSPSPFELFAGWILHSRTLDIILVKDTVNVYEGNAAASVRTTAPPGVGPSILIVRQYVDVTPGCLYRLKFAERMVTFIGDDGHLPVLVARVVYLDRNLNEYELLNIPIQKTEADAEYNLHEQTADLPVPCDIPGIIVQFSFYITDAPGSVWNLDDVSLQSVCRISACC
jgi:hypothetical protein